MEINRQAKAILAGGQALSNEINEAIRGVVISNAPAIERFHERHEELTRVNHLFLFYYSVSLILFFTSSAGDWEDETNSVIDRMSEEFVRALRFRAAAQDDPQGETHAIAAQLRSTFENVSSNFKRLGEVVEEGNAAMRYSRWSSRTFKKYTPRR
jgi:hypothetical protein